jgi:hypothetical protein
MNVGDELNHIREVFRLRDLPWRSFYFGQNYKVPDEIGVSSYPTYIVIDRDQTIRSISHSVDYRALDELLSPQ